jgi:hypothetical protein
MIDVPSLQNIRVTQTSLLQPYVAKHFPRIGRIFDEPYVAYHAWRPGIVGLTEDEARSLLAARETSGPRSASTPTATNGSLE